MSSIMSPDMTSSFALIADALQEARDDWWLIGGAAFWAHGLAAAGLKDIDVLLSYADAKQIARRYDLHAISVEGTDLFRSRALFQWMTPAIPVEFMSELEVKSGAQWHPVLPNTREEIILEGMQVFVPDADELMHIGKLFGRPKDLARVKQLQNLLQTTN